MLFEPFAVRTLKLKNRIVMAPMTRSRAFNANTANELMAEYYGQRATAGLIITEGTSPSPNGLGYARIPALYNQTHVRGWRAVTTAVHERGARIFVQLMHTGRVTHLANLPPSAEVLGPGSAVCPGQMYTDSGGLLPHSVPRPMTDADIAHVIGEYSQSASLALEAGFDGVELHGANGYLIEQFLNPHVNDRVDDYGKTVEGRNRLAIEIAKATVAAIGGDRVGMRLSPYGIFNATGEFPEVEPQYLALAHELSSIGLLYLHLLDHSATGAPPVPAAFKVRLRTRFDGLLILAGGFDRAAAEAALAEGRADLIAFGRPFLANPDLVARLRTGAPLNTPDPATLYTAGAKGYTDYLQLAA